MNTSRSITSLASIYQNDTIENSLLDWISIFDIDSFPYSFNQIYTGVALFEVLNKIDMTSWPKNKL